MTNLDNENFLNNYLENLNSLTFDLDKSKLIDVANKIISDSKYGRTTFVVGNGGSAAIASHVAVDFLKALGLRAMTFNESSLITCYANDYGYENWVKEALKSYCNKNDNVILISSSGESPNIINAAKYVKKNNLFLITFSGFKKNNTLSELGNLNIWVNSANYNYVEIIHNKFLLILVDLIKFNLKKL